MEINSITFNGINSLDYGLYVSGDKTFNSAEKDYSKVSVPGRSGDLLFFNKRFKNVNVTYSSIVISDYYQNTEKIRSWLMSADGYCRLEDTYHPKEYRMACFAGPIDFTTIMLEAGTTDLIFDCKPQRWLKSGEVPITFVTGNLRSLYNPCSFESKPKIRVYGNGRLQVGTGDLTINQAGDDYIDIDCDLQDCYEDGINRNQNVSITKWPTLTPGNNIVSMESTITKIEVIPRWWFI